jgi:hypothetical protein
MNKSSKNKENSNRMKIKSQSTRKVNNSKKLKERPDDTMDLQINREGSKTVDNTKMKRKLRLKRLSQEEFKVDSNKIDTTVLELWNKFVVYYDYECTFKLDHLTKQEREVLDKYKQKSEVDFELKLNTIFNIYKIRKSPDDHNLISDSEEGSYLIRHVGIWIIYIKTLIEKSSFKFKDLHPIFNFALEYGVDEYSLFDYFICLTKEFDEEEILEFDEHKVPINFYNLYINNRDLILKQIKEDYDNQTKNNTLKPLEDEITLHDEEVIELPLSTDEEKREDANHLNINDFSFDQKDENLDEYLNPDKVNLNNTIQEESKESESIGNISNLKDSIKKINSQILNDIKGVNTDAESDLVMHLTHLTPKKNEKGLIVFNSLSQSKKNEFSLNLKKYLYGKDIYENDEAVIVESNIRNSGNFAVLELTSKSQEKIGTKYVLTPLKKKRESTVKDLKEVEEDLKLIHTDYSDFIYQPYNETLKSLIEDNN